MPDVDNSVTLQEIGRTLQDFRSEVRSQLQQLVRTDVYRAEQAADRARIAALEKASERDDESRANDRRLVFGSLASAALSFVGSLLLVLLTR